ncbi:(deoxy)nucleoside triphosphate pyrophosphohydrolase [Paenibacillus sp. PL2-23]|uniref:(deoxy)nucleoside triphosphate pyrophosphohydrolase n=1 Tax=Paenibacillus sp. PL2-23 TaxID=2100729 RepID=UPI0030F75EE1
MEEQQLGRKQIHVVGAVIVREGLVLCAQRGAGQSMASLWEFPGGKIEIGETPQDALKREIAEEMRCQIRVGERVEYTAHEYAFGIVHLTTFYCEVLSGEPQLTEHAAMRWLRPEELLSLEWAPADVPAVQAIMSKYANPHM